MDEVGVGVEQSDGDGGGNDVVEVAEQRSNKVQADKHNQSRLYMSHHQPFQKFRTKEYKLQHVRSAQQKQLRRLAFQ